MFERGDIAAALQIYQQLAAQHRDVAEVALYLGIARYVHHEYEDAARELRACLCLDSSLWPAAFYLARACEELGLRADALQQYDQIAVDDLQPLTLRSESAIINEMRAFRHDIKTAARRVSADRGVSLRRLIK